MFRTIHTRLTGGAMRWLAVPMLLVVAGAAAVSVAAGTGPLQTGFGVSAAAKACPAQHPRCAARQQLPPIVVSLPRARLSPDLTRVGPAQAISPMTPAQQARMAKLRAELQAAYATH